MVEDILVTGGSGFVGRPIVRALVAAGHRVRMLVRRDDSARLAITLGARPVHGDLLDPHSLEVAMHGVTVVVHAAASWSQSGTYEDHARINVTGTRHVLDAAQAAGVRRFVHISDASVVIDGARPTDGDERLPVIVDAGMPYSATKAEAETMVLAANSATMTALALRPSFVWGEEAPAISQLSSAFRQKQFAWIGEGAHPYSVTHADNLAQAVVQSLTQGRAGQAYFITDDEVTSVRSFVTELVATQGQEVVACTVPGWAASFLARTFGRLFSWLRPGQQPPITLENVRLLGQGLRVSNDLAKRELGYQPPVPRAEGMARLAELMNAHVARLAMMAT